uniref:Putative metabolite transport protein GIT1 n=1 Tax=Talaromyces marneffei PM1 TaxID=1077442 RepID=A0A093Y524_TALMA
MEQEAAEVVGDDKRQVEETVKSYPNYHHGGDAPIGRKSISCHSTPAEVYGTAMSSTIKSRLSNSYLIGEIFGMLFFGVQIDRMGRRTGIMTATALLVLGVALATAAHGKSDLGMFWMMIVARGVAGFGAGGEYPVCAANATEASDETSELRTKRGFLVALTTDFAIDLGFVIAGVVPLIVLACYHQAPSAGVWKVSFGLGVVRYWKTMLGTCLAWFCYDFVTYPFGIFSSTIIGQLNPNNTTVENIGYGTVFPLFVVMYGIFNALGEMGPGVATFLCAAESFPTPLRGHFLGWAAAVGMAGTSIGTEVFTPIQNSFSSTEKGQQAVFVIGSAFCVMGGLISWFLIPDMLRELETEDLRFRIYLEENGYTYEDGMIVSGQETS